MKLGAISELEINLIRRELLVKVASAVGIRQAWLLENQALKACLVENYSELTQLMDQYVDVLWSCHFFARTVKDTLTETEQQRYLELVNQKDHLRGQLTDLFPVG